MKITLICLLISALVLSSAQSQKAPPFTDNEVKLLRKLGFVEWMEKTSGDVYNAGLKGAEFVAGNIGEMEDLWSKGSTFAEDAKNVSQEGVAVAQALMKAVQDKDMVAASALVQELENFVRDAEIVVTEGKYVYNASKDLYDKSPFIVRLRRRLARNRRLRKLGNIGDWVANTGDFIGNAGHVVGEGMEIKEDMDNARNKPWKALNSASKIPQWQKDAQDTMKQGQDVINNRPFVNRRLALKLRKLGLNSFLNSIGKVAKETVDVGTEGVKVGEELVNAVKSKDINAVLKAAGELPGLTKEIMDLAKEVKALTGNRRD